jgi:hypothetical protein
MAVMDHALIAAVTAPHLLYACIWILPDVWRRAFFPRNSVQAMAYVANALKGSKNHPSSLHYTSVFP